MTGTFPNRSDVENSIMEASSKQTSKLVSYWLRHHPEDAGLAADDFGWVSGEQLLAALHSRNIRIDWNGLLQLARSFDKIRWEIDEAGRKIRATHGHSFPVLLEEKAKKPPGELYHGTALKNVLLIAEQGLLPMNRQFVHLSETIEMALQVGSRHGKPVIVEVSTGPLCDAGWKFYQTSDNVWLTSAVPADFLTFKPWLRVDPPAGHGLEELKREIGNRRSHFLFPQLDQLELVWVSAASDDTLFLNRETGECFMVHLTYKGKEEIDGYPYIEKYRTLEDWLEKGLRRDQQDHYSIK